MWCTTACVNCQRFTGCWGSWTTPESVGGLDHYGAPDSACAVLAEADLHFTQGRLHSKVAQLMLKSFIWELTDGCLVIPTEQLKYYRCAVTRSWRRQRPSDSRSSTPDSQRLQWRTATVPERVQKHVPQVHQVSEYRRDSQRVEVPFQRDWRSWMPSWFDQKNQLRRNWNRRGKTSRHTASRTAMPPRPLAESECWRTGGCTAVALTMRRIPRSSVRLRGLAVHSTAPVRLLWGWKWGEARLWSNLSHVREQSAQISNRGWLRAVLPRHVSCGKETHLVRLNEEKAWMELIVHVEEEYIA